VAQDAATYFRSRFGGEPLVIASAPGRVNLIGEHLDYNGGEVLPMAIARRTSVAMRPLGGDRSTAASAGRADAGTFDVEHPTAARRWWDYVAGIAAELRAHGLPVPQAEIAVTSDVPTGSGLSSSAALEMSAGLAYCALLPAEARPPLRDLALLGQRVESGFVGVASGIMDQFASALSREGTALHLWCDTVEYEHVPMRDAILIFDTRVPRSLRGSPFNERQRECVEALRWLQREHPSLPNLAAATPDMLVAARLPDPLARRARHVVTELQRVRATVATLQETGTLPGAVLYESHASLRVDFECSSRELDWFVEHAMRCDGVTGARLTGAGWGGCAIASGPHAALNAAIPQLERDYEQTFGHAPQTWVTHAAAGAAIEPVQA